MKQTCAKFSNKLSSYNLINNPNFNISFYPLELHPIFYANIFLIAGIGWWASNFSFLFPTACAFAGSLYFLVNRNIKTKSYSFKLYLLALICFSSGAFIYRSKLGAQSKFHKIIENKKDFRATIESINEIDSLQFRYKTLAWLENEQSRIQIYTRRKPQCEIADRVLLKNLKISCPKNKKFCHFLLKENVVGCSYTSSLAPDILHHPRFSFARMCSNIRQSLQMRLKKKLNPQAYSLWSTIFLGDKSTTSKKQMNKIKTQCKNWGISHYLARSGLHLMLFIFLWLMLLKLLPLSFGFKQFIIVLLVLTYSLLSIASVSFLRALITFLFYKFCQLQYLEIRPLHIVNVSCFLSLLYNPIYLFYLDFQLSYSLTIAVTWFSELEARKKLLIKA